MVVRFGRAPPATPTARVTAAAAAFAVCLISQWPCTMALHDGPLRGVAHYWPTTMAHYWPRNGPEKNNNFTSPEPGWVHT